MLSRVCVYWNYMLVASGPLPFYIKPLNTIGAWQSNGGTDRQTNTRVALCIALSGKSSAVSTSINRGSTEACHLQYIVSYYTHTVCRLAAKVWAWLTVCSGTRVFSVAVHCRTRHVTLQHDLSRERSAFSFQWFLRRDAMHNADYAVTVRRQSARVSLCPI